MRYLLMLSLLLLASCADPARNLYQGIQLQQEAQRTPLERALSPAPSYDQYKQEREQ
ncbi:MAG: hypothetical protein AB1722_11570 [Pseudomonadota bacterium]